MANTDSQKGKTLSGLLKEKFDTQIAGKPVALYTLTNKNGAEICITNFGGIVVSLMIPDVSGKMTDVVLGHESIEEYLNTPEKFLGALIGRYGNRIKKGSFVLDGTRYNIRSNNPDCVLHGGIVVE